VLLAPWYLDGRTALVTGGGTGIGRATAIRLAECGANVVVVGRRAEELAQVVAIAPKQMTALVADVRDLNGLPALVSDIVGSAQSTPTIDIFVHAAGAQVKRSAADHDSSDWDDTLAVHLRAFARISELVVQQATGQPAIDGGRSIVAVGSMAAKLGFANVSAYSAAKGAVTALTRSLAVEWAPLGFRVNSVTPGWIDTPITQRAFAADPAHRDRILARTPLGRIGDADDVALAVAYLASPAAAFVTGSDLVIDGGASVSL